MIWAVPGISANRRRRLGGADGVGDPADAAATRVVEAALPIDVDALGAGTPIGDAVCPMKGDASGAAKAGAGFPLAGEVSLGNTELVSWD